MRRADRLRKVSCPQINVADVANQTKRNDISASGEHIFKQGAEPTRASAPADLKGGRLGVYSKDTMTEIALAVGYASATPMVQNYEEVFGVHPSDDRAKINMFRVRENVIVPSA